MTKEEFIKKAIVKHGNFYNYDKVDNLIFSKDKVCIVCPKHGDFFQRQDIHLSGKGCPKCGHERTGKACRSKNLEVATTIIEKIQVIENPKIPYENYIIGSIYLFVNKINNKKYVGQTYKKYSERWTQHKIAKDNFYFHIALNKYGWDNFDKFILEQSEYYINTEENRNIIISWLDEKESYYINFFNSNNDKYGYNLTEGGHTHGKISTKIPKEHKSQGKQVEQYDLEGNLVKIWNSIKEIYTTTEFKNDGIQECSKGLRDNYKGFRWKILENKKSDNTINPITFAKPILQYDLEGNFIKEFSSSQEVQRILGYNSSLIRSCCRNEIATSKNFIWIFKSDKISFKLPLEELESRNLDTRIKQISLDGNLIKIWRNTSEIEEELLFPKAQISQCIRGRSKTSNGFIWKSCSLRDLINDNLIHYKN